MVDHVNATLLGSPIGDVSSISKALEEKCSFWNQWWEGSIIFTLMILSSSSTTLSLTRSCCTDSESPCFLSPMLLEYDQLLKSIGSYMYIVNITFSENDAAWSQATQSVKWGGLGIRSAVQLVPSVFLASATACWSTLSLHLISKALLV